MYFFRSSQDIRAACAAPAGPRMLLHCALLRAGSFAQSRKGGAAWCWAVLCCAARVQSSGKSNRRGRVGKLAEWRVNSAAVRLVEDATGGLIHHRGRRYSPKEYTGGYTARVHSFCYTARREIRGAGCKHFAYMCCILAYKRKTLPCWPNSPAVLAAASGASFCSASCSTRDLIPVSFAYSKKTHSQSSLSPILASSTLLLSSLSLC
ncbi:hypothetical protein GQ54DRAFT_218556 [Martensiomyces pterosporus]|nr:hypothetical protein GQ54DRAFT_218556 [Martensiomyces pterosporus]